MKSKEFFDYLFYIGIVSNDTLQLLKSTVDKKTKENENDKYLNKHLFMKSLMGDYLISLNKEDLNKLGSNIYEKYISNKSITITKHLIKLFSILEKMLFYNLQSIFNFWKNLVFNKQSHRPKIFQRSKSTDKLYRMNNKINNLSNSNNIYNIKSNNNYNNYISSENFFSRLNEYNMKREKEIKKEKIKNEDDIGKICTFSPNLSLTKKKNNEFRKKYDNNKVDDIKRINKLYNDFQKKNINKEILKKNIEKEKGFTFSPRLNVNSPYNKKIKENFYERNKKLLSDKIKFIEGFNILRDLQMKGVDINIQFSQDNSIK